MGERRELDGYRIDVAYNHDYHRELSPVFLRLLTPGRSAQIPPSRPLRYLELGYGNGVPLNIHAAACPGEYWGTDANPAHAASAKALAGAAGSDVKVLALSFADLLERTDLPQFDVITAHGVWSWVSAETRTLVVEILKRHLVDGGIFFMTSVSLPAEAEIVPLQRLLRLQDKDDPEAALELAQALQAAGSPYFAADTRAGRRLQSLRNADSNYLVHEYRHETWQPFAFADIARALAPAGLRFAASANPLDRYDDLNFTPAQCALLASIEDSTVRETARDFLRSRQRRQDIFVKTGKSIEAANIPPDQKFVLSTPVFSAITRAKFSTPPSRQVVERLGEDDYRPKRLDQLSAAGHDMLRAVLALVDAGIVHPVQPRAQTERAAEACARLNVEILNRALTGDTIGVLASPVTGGGVSVSRNQRLFLLARRQGASTPVDWVKFALRIQPAETADLLKEALLFQTRLPCFEALGLIDQA